LKAAGPSAVVRQRDQLDRGKLRPQGVACAVGRGVVDEEDPVGPAGLGLERRKALAEKGQAVVRDHYGADLGLHAGELL